MARRAITARVSGMVQGVGFRYYTQMTARRLDLDGWVRNRMDGTVEVYAEGDDEDLRQFESYLHDGPPSARVSRADIRSVDAQGTHSGFAVH